MNKNERALGGFLGLAIGDTIGGQVEFKARGSFPLVTDMIGGGVFNLRPGQITDDTEMALAIARSLTVNGKFVPTDIMDRFLAWSKTTFDIGNTIKSSLQAYEINKNPFQGRNNVALSGNGSIMRLYPTVLWTLNQNDKEAFELVWDVSRLTHASVIVRESTDTMLSLIRKIFAGQSKDEILKNISFSDEPESSGFVRHTLQAALWGFATTNSFEEGLLKVVNLGDDADTVGAVYGQIAGSYYGRSGLPDKWVEKIECREEIEDLVSKLSKGPS